MRGDIANLLIAASLPLLAASGTSGSNPLSSTGESKANPISWIMVDADAKKLAGATPITGFGRLLRKH
jgi:hypothetical protein